MSKISSPKSISELVELGLRTGCGACAFAAPDRFAMEMNSNGHLNPVEKDGCPEPETSELLTLCPMSGGGTDDSEFAERIWPDLPQDHRIGRYRRTLATHLTDTEARLASGSGGIVTWLGKDLLRRGEVDCVIHVKAAAPGERPLFRYTVSRSPQEVQAGAKSRYYPIELSGVAQSQSSGLRHRRERLAHRLAGRFEADILVPRKRVEPKLTHCLTRREIYDIRLEITETSNSAFARARAAGDIGLYQAEMAGRLAWLRRLSRVSLPRKVRRKLLQQERGLCGRSAA